MPEVLDLYGTTSQVAHKAFLKSFWDEFGKNGNKHYRSAQKKQLTLERLKLIGEMVVLRRNTPTKNLGYRAKFEAVKYGRHNLKTKKMCFACGRPASVRHHIIWLKNGGMNFKRNLISLCSECHTYIHPWMKKG